MKKIFKVFLAFFIIITGWLNSESLISEGILSTSSSPSELTQDLDLPAQDFLKKHPEIRFFLFSRDAHALVNFSREEYLIQAFIACFGSMAFRYGFTSSSSCPIEHVLGGLALQMIYGRLAGKHISFPAFLSGAIAYSIPNILLGNFK